MQPAIDQQIKLARAAIAKHQFTDAIRHANEIVRKYRDDARGWLLLSEINIATGKFSYALDNALQSVKLDPSWVPSLAQLARCYMMVQQKQQATDIAKRAALLNPEDAESLDAIAAILTLCDEQELALLLAEQAVKLYPKNPWYRYNLATTQRMLGKLDEAEENCDKAIAYNPDDFQAYYVRSDLRKQTTARNHISQMEERLASGVNQWRAEMIINFALAKEKEDIEDFENSF